MTDPPGRCDPWRTPPRFMNGCSPRIDPGAAGRLRLARADARRHARFRVVEGDQSERRATAAPTETPAPRTRCDRAGEVRLLLAAAAPARPGAGRRAPRRERAGGPLLSRAGDGGAAARARAPGTRPGFEARRSRASRRSTGTSTSSSRTSRDERARDARRRREAGERKDARPKLVRRTRRLAQISFAENRWCSWPW